jgi:hypothetical protein
MIRFVGLLRVFSGVEAIMRLTLPLMMRAMEREKKTGYGKRRKTPRWGMYGPKEGI